MAPKRKQRNANGEAKPSATATAVAATARVTRSSTRRDNVASAKAAVATEPPKKKKSKTAAAAVAEKKSETPPSLKAESKVPGTSKTIIIEHCKQCNSFKTRAVQVKKGLEKEVTGVNVLVNPEKPRRGCFEIREEGGEIFLSLQDLERPFTPMKDLDMEKVISDIIDKIE